MQCKQGSATDMGTLHIPRWVGRCPHVYLHKPRVTHVPWLVPLPNLSKAFQLFADLIQNLSGTQVFPPPLNVEETETEAPVHVYTCVIT